MIIEVENVLKKDLSSKDLLDVFITNYSDLEMVVKKDLVLDFEVKLVKRDQLSFSTNSGKLKNVIDHRN